MDGWRHKGGGGRQVDLAVETYSDRDGGVASNGSGEAALGCSRKVAGRDGRATPGVATCAPWAAGGDRVDAPAVGEVDVDRDVTCSGVGNERRGRGPAAARKRGARENAR